MNKNLKTYADLMPCKPRRMFEHEQDAESGRVIVLRPKYLSRWTVKFIMPMLKQKYFRVKLDELGSEVWRNCDGEKTVDQLIQLLQKKFGADEEQLAERLSKFILHLQKEKFIELRCPSAV